MQPKLRTKEIVVSVNPTQYDLKEDGGKREVGVARHWHFDIYSMHQETKKNKFVVSYLDIH